MAKVKQGTEEKKKKTFKQEAQKDMALDRVKSRPYNPKDDFETYKKRTQAMGGDVFTAQEMRKKIADKKSANISTRMSPSGYEMAKGGRAGFKSGSKDYKLGVKFQGDYKGKSVPEKIKEFVKTGVKQTIGTAKNIRNQNKKMSGGRIGLKSGSKGCKLATKGKGRAYGKNS